MKNLKNLFLVSLVLAATALTGCLHIIEEATFRNNGSGNYKMTFDMSELKGMMDMMKGMGGEMPVPETGDSTNISDGGDFTPPPPPAPEEDPMGGLSEQFSGVTSLLSNVDGISNIVEIKDTASFSFGYSFDFANINALNRALKIVGKDKFESKNEETFKFNGKSFERLNAGDMSAELKNAMGGAEESEEAEGQADMMKMFLADMSYKQIYHFPDRKVKKSDNKWSEMSDDGHTMTIKLKPFDEEQQKKKASVAAKVKLK
jgi:hypothetical protein